MTLEEPNNRKMIRQEKLATLKKHLPVSNEESLSPDTARSEHSIISETKPFILNTGIISVGPRSPRCASVTSLPEISFLTNIRRLVILAIRVPENQHSSIVTTSNCFN